MKSNSCPLVIFKHKDTYTNKYVLLVAIFPSSEGLVFWCSLSMTTQRPVTMLYLTLTV